MDENQHPWLVGGLGPGGCLDSDWIPLGKGFVTLEISRFESQTTGPQTTNETLAEKTNLVNNRLKFTHPLVDASQDF